MTAQDDSQQAELFGGAHSMTCELLPSKLDRDATFYVAGHAGLVGSAVMRRLKASGFSNVVGKSSREMDLRRRESVLEYLLQIKPKYVIVAAARVGGILANNTYPADFISDNLQIQVNLLDGCLEAGVDRVLFLGSSCIYPKFAKQPISEDQLLTGPLEPTNDAYAISKIAGIIQVQAIRRQYGLPWISAMPTNLYGPGDNFSSLTSHVLPSLIRRYEDAVRSGTKKVINWGSGSPRRDFLHVDDAADACLYLLEHYDGPSHVNIGSGVDVTIRELAETVASVAGYTGETDWDTTKPDGTPRKLLDCTYLARLGWTPKIGLREGIESTFRWYRTSRERGLASEPRDHGVD